MKPHKRNGLLKIPGRASSHPPLARCAIVCAMASRMTMRPNQRCNRLYVSNEMPKSGIRGLFLPARRNKGTCWPSS